MSLRYVNALHCRGKVPSFPRHRLAGATIQLLPIQQRLLMSALQEGSNLNPWSCLCTLLDSKSSSSIEKGRGPGEKGGVPYLSQPQQPVCNSKFLRIQPSAPLAGAVPTSGTTLHGGGPRTQLEMVAVVAHLQPANTCRLSSRISELLDLNWEVKILLMACADH